MNDENPKVGSIVQYWDTEPSDDKQPKAAVVTRVWSPSCVNLYVFPADHNEHAEVATSATRRHNPTDLGWSLPGDVTWLQQCKPKSE